MYVESSVFYWNTTVILHEYTKMWAYTHVGRQVLTIAKKCIVFVRNQFKSPEVQYSFRAAWKPVIIDQHGRRQNVEFHFRN